MARLFFVAYGGGHVAMLLPVAKAALRRGEEVTFLGLTTARAVLEQAGIAAIGFADLWTFAAAGARRYGRELSAQLPAGGAIAIEESQAYLGMSFAELVAERGEQAAREAYAQHGRHAFLPVALLERVIGHYRPDVVVATNSPRAEQAAIVAAGRLGVRSVCAVDLFALQEIRWIGQPGYADRICVLNDTVRSMFLRRGRREAEVVVTGNPAFDALNDPAAVRAGADLRRTRGWDDGRCNVLWASQVEPARHPFNGEAGDPSLPRRVEWLLRGVVDAHDGLRLVIRYHPSEHEVFVPAPRVEHSPTGEPLAHLLHAVDLVVVTASTVGLEAFIAGRPVLSINCSVFTADAPYSTMGIAVGVDSIEALPVALLDAVGRRMSAPPASVAGDADAATGRVMRVIESLLPAGA